jgi:hypothetical protein
MPGTDVDVRSKVFLDRIAMLILLASLVVLQSLEASAQGPAPLYENVTATHLPELDGPSMDAGLADFDGDGAIDLFLASRHTQDLLLFSTAGHACDVQPCPRAEPRRPRRRVSIR